MNFLFSLPTQHSHIDFEKCHTLHTIEARNKVLVIKDISWRKKWLYIIILLLPPLNWLIPQWILSNIFRNIQFQYIMIWTPNK